MSSRKKHAWILICCTVALAVLILLEPSYGWRLRSWLSPGVNASASNDDVLTAQNESLQAQLAVLQLAGTEIPQDPGNDIRAMVYSQYPFSFKNDLLVNAGSDEGVALGKAVTFQGVFVGTIQQVFSDSAVVQTVFDPNFKIPVRIGSGGYDALFVGGSYPKATSIAKTDPVQAGDIIYTAAPDLPYGLPIGTVSATSTSQDNLFQEALLNISYDINSVQTVLISK